MDLVEKLTQMAKERDHRVKCSVSGATYYDQKLADEREVLEEAVACIRQFELERAGARAGNKYGQ